MVGCAEDRGGEHGKAFLLKNVVDLSMFAADVEQELVFLLKHSVTEAAPQVVHQTRELLRQLLHKVAAAVLLQLVQAVHLLLANLKQEIVLTNQSQVLWSRDPILPITISHISPDIPARSCSLPPSPCPELSWIKEIETPLLILNLVLALEEQQRAS